MPRVLALLLGSLALVLAAASCEAPGSGVGGREAAALEPCDDPEALASWEAARAALARGDDRAALPRLQVAVTRCPDLVRAHCAYQDAARRLGGAAAEEMVARYTGLQLEGSPLPAYLRARLAETAYAQANELSELLSRYPSFAWGHLSLARVNRGQGRLSEALSGFGRALRNAEDLHEARLERGQVLGELGRNDEAAVDFRAYLAARPGDVAAMREFVGLLLYRIGRIDEALQWIDRLAASGDDSVALRMDRAAAQWRSGAVRAAVEGYVAVLEEQPDNARAALNVGLLYYEVVPQGEAGRRRRWPQARAAFRMFLAGADASDGHERFERTWAVPYRLRQIEALLGPAPTQPPQVEALRWQRGG